jgi:hypothetical protein
MSVINPHRCCPICGDRNFTEVARIDADPAIGQDEDEAVYRCVAVGHEFTSNDHVWDVHEDDDYPHATNDTPATPLAAAGVTRHSADPFRTADGDIHPRLRAAIDERVFEIMHARDALAIRGVPFGPADILAELRKRGGAHAD